MGITLLNDLCYGHLKDSMHVYVYILVNVYSRLLYNACVSASTTHLAACFQYHLCYICLKNTGSTIRSLLALHLTLDLNCTFG